MHLEDGRIHAYLDDELAEADRRAAESHLASCEVCGTRVDEMRSRLERVGARLAVLAPSVSSTAPTRTGVIPAHVALARFKEQQLRKENPLMRKIFSPRYRPAWGLISVLALLTLSISFAPVRAWAEGLLAQFRVERVTILPIDPTRLSELGSNESLGKQINQLMADSLVVSKEAIKPHSVADKAEASKTAGFAVRLPSSRADTPYITVQGGLAYQFTINLQRTQALMNQLGSDSLQLPASLDGAPVKVNIPIGVTAAYGSCPKLPQEGGPQVTDSSSRAMANCVIFAQVPSPSVDAPPQVDIPQIAEVGLQFIGMSREQAKSFTKTVDWTSTLVVPVPRNGSSYKQVQVDGVDAYLIRRPPQYSLVWVKKGIIYAIGGMADDTEAALQMANSLK